MVRREAEGNDRAHLLSRFDATISVHAESVLMPEGALFEEVDLRERTEVSETERKREERRRR